MSEPLGDSLKHHPSLFDHIGPYPIAGQQRYRAFHSHSS
jgi:hypothetical protein